MNSGSWPRGPGAAQPVPGVSKCGVSKKGNCASWHRAVRYLVRTFPDATAFSRVAQVSSPHALRDMAGRWRDKARRTPKTLRPHCQEKPSTPRKGLKVTGSRFYALLLPPHPPTTTSGDAHASPDVVLVEAQRGGGSRSANHCSRRLPVPDRHAATADQARCLVPGTGLGGGPLHGLGSKSLDASSEYGRSRSLTELRRPCPKPCVRNRPSPTWCYFRNCFTFETRERP